LIEYNCPEYIIGLVFAIPCLTLTIVAIFVEKLLNTMTRRTIISVGIFTMLIAIFLMGPSLLLGLPQELSLILIALALLGVANALTMVPIFPEVYEGICLAYNL